MKRFSCPSCNSEVYFESTSCVGCQKPIGYLPLVSSMLTLDFNDSDQLVGAHSGQEFQYCANAEQGACNWLVPSGESSGYCVSCRHNRIIPNLSVPKNLEGWRALELAKRQLFYSLIRWRLPLPTRSEEPTSGLVFDVLANATNPDGNEERVLTGHQDGVITLNIAEADDAEREKMRNNMGEPYRTLVGHFRHEIGHFYWDRLVRDGGLTGSFREAFGDERADYAAALQRNYNEGPPRDWPANFISAYASVHPWEDFAETWAHYIHMVDGLETARAYGMKFHSSNQRQDEAEVDFQPYDAPTISAIIDVWVPFTLALNSINRSIGQHDFYPFVISPATISKLDFVYRLLSC